MSAHQGAPGLGRAQLATPTHPASTRGPAFGARRAGRPMFRRKAMFVAAATLCAPAFAALALAALAATGGGSDQAAMGSLAGTQGLRGTASPAQTTIPQAKTDRATEPVTTSKRGPGESAATQPARARPAPKANTPAPVHKPAPTPPHKVSPMPPPNLTSPSVPPYDPSQPGAPTPNTVGSGASSGSGTGTTTSGSGSGSHGHGDGSGSPDSLNAYSGGG